MKRTILFLLAGAAFQLASAQDIHFSQFYETSILRNPAQMGIFNGDYKVGVVYRDQWSSISKPFQTGMVNLETRIPVNESSNDFFSVGALAYYDKAGSIDLQTIGVYPAVSFSKSLGGEQHTSFLSAGFTGGYIQRSYDPGKATFGSQYQNNHYSSSNGSGENLPDNHIQNWDLGAGISFSSTTGEAGQITYFVGAGGYHFTQPNRSFYDSDDSLAKLGMKWTGSAGMSVKIDETYGLQILANYSRQGSYNETIAGALVSWKRGTTRDDDPAVAIYAGVFYRVGDALIPTLKLDYMRYSFSASYDITTSGLKTAAQGYGGFELTVFKTGVFSSPKWEQSRTACPKFW